MQGNTALGAAWLRRKQGVVSLQGYMYTSQVEGEEIKAFEAGESPQAEREGKKRCSWSGNYRKPLKSFKVVGVKGAGC